MTKLTIEEYLALPYTVEVIPDATGDYSGYFARVVELPGCMTQAADFAELEDMIQDAMRAWIEAALEDGLPIPMPQPDEEYSGKFVVRLPRSLHRRLAEVADRESVSLNMLVNTALAHYLGAATALQNEDVKRIGAHK